MMVDGVRGSGEMMVCGVGGGEICVILWLSEKGEEIIHRLRELGWVYN